MPKYMEMERLSDWLLIPKTCHNVPELGQKSSNIGSIWLTVIQFGHIKAYLKGATE